jgi:hypothetical protein
VKLAYLDPTSGGMLLQIILGGLAAVAVALKMWWRRLLLLLRIRKPEDEALDPVREPAGKP